MAKRDTHSTINTAEHIIDRLGNRDLDVMRGLVTAGAVVALADGGVAEVEREELLNFIDRQQLVPTIPRTDVAETFDRRVRQLEDRDSAEMILESLRPLVGLSLWHPSCFARLSESLQRMEKSIPLNCKPSN